jgi:hypothetical protein
MMDSKVRTDDKGHESGVSEVVSSILIVFLAILAAGVIGVYILESVDNGYLEEPVFAYFSTDIINGMGTGGKLNVPVIRMYQSHGGDLEQRYKEGTHSGIEGMKIVLYDPKGNGHEVVQSITMKGGTVDIGAIYYIFYYNLPEPEADYWITNDPKRIFGPTYRVHPFPIHGAWRMVITEEDRHNTILADIPLNL